MFESSIHFKQSQVISSIDQIQLISQIDADQDNAGLQQNYHNKFMYKVGVMMMGKIGTTSPKKVREVILEVEAKTKIANIFEYLLELDKIKNMDVEICIEKSGQPINDQSTVSQILKYSRPVNGVIKLYLYEIQSKDITVEKLVLKPSRHEVHNPQAYQKVQEQAERQKQSIKKIEKEKQEQKSTGICCC